MFNFRNVVAIAAVAMTVAAPVIAQSTQSVTIRNRSGVTLTNFWASAQSNNSWENELLGNRVLRSGQNYGMTIQNVIDCIYDFRMEFSTGNVVTDRVNICQIADYTITP